METPRTAKAHFIWTSVALVVVLIASCLTYVFVSKVPTRQIVSAPFLFNLTATAMENMTRRQSSREHWLLKAQRCSRMDGRLIWVDEWEHNRNKSENILDDNNMWIVIREKGVYLFYIQANFKLKSQINSGSTIDLKLVVEFDYGEDTQIFAAAHDTHVVNSNLVQDAKLNTFLMMNMNPSNRLSVKAFPSDAVEDSSRPFSTFVTLIKWSDDW